MELQGRTATVAGGAGGLGGATVRHLVSLGIGAVILDPDAVIPKDVLRANLELHVYGPFNLARLAAAAFAANEPDPDGQRGVIVQTASISAFDGQATMVPYAAAKGAVVGMVLPMARDLAPLGVRVCAIAPGGFLTPRGSSPQVQALLVEDVVFPKRLGAPEEYALLVEAIIRNPYLNGEVIRLDGAARLAPAMGWRSNP